MANRSRDWFAQAERDLEQARLATGRPLHSDTAIRHAGEILDLARARLARPEGR